MLDRFRGWTGRYLITNLSPFRRHQSRKDQIRTFRNKDGLAITIDEFLPDSGATRLEKPTASTRSNLGWLSAFTLLSTALLFFLLGFALLLVWHYNTAEDGFALVTHNHYSWTYGPTAILVFVVAFWRQIDYHCKVAMPWMNLTKGSASSQNSVLLDHISPLQVMSFWQAMRSRHTLVILTITGFAILKLITLASTGLLLVEPVELPARTISVNAVEKFNGSLYNVTDFVTKADASIVYNAYGIMEKGLAPTAGITDHLVYTQFNCSNQLGFSSGKIRTHVDAFLPGFNCQPAEVSINPTPYTGDDGETAQTIIVNSPSCELMGGSQPVFVLDPSSELCPPRQFRGVITRVNCSMDAKIDPLPDRRLLTLVEVAYNQTFNSTDGTNASAGSSQPDIISWSVSIQRTASLLCRPSYSLGNLSVTYTAPNEQNLVAGEVEVLNTTLANFHDNDLALMFAAALSDASNMFGDLTESDSAEDFPNTMFKLMATSSGGRYEGLLDQTVMTEAAESAFNHIAVQLVSENLLGAASTPLSAQMFTLDDRLAVSTLPFWIMLIGFVAMCILSLLTFLMRPKNNPSARLKTLSGMALVLAQSRALHDVVRDVGGLKEADVSKTLDGYLFSSDTNMASNGQLEVSIQPFINNDGTSRTPTMPMAGEEVWWKPFTCRPTLVLSILLLPLLVIVALELLQRQSDPGGILTLPVSDRTAATLYTRFLPSLVMLIVATSFNAIDFNISLLAPFNSMSNRAVPAHRSTESALVDKLPPVALWQALRSRHYAAFCSGTAATIGSLLTIVVSGLYSVDSITDYSQVVVRSNDTFNTTWTNSATEDRSAAVLTSLTESTSLLYPTFTYDELALPSAEVLLGAINVSTVSDMQLTYPVLRASLSCSILDPASFNVSASYNSRLESSSANVNANIPLPQNCPFGGPGGNLSFIEVNYRVGFQTNQSYVGKLLDLHVGPYDPILGSAFGESDLSAQRDNPPGCPSLAFIYGYVDIDNSSATSITTLMCYQQMQRLQATFNFLLPSMIIPKNLPPMPDESTVELLNSTSDGDTTFSYRIQQHTDQSLSLFNQTKYASANLQQAPVDNFFQGVLFGLTPLPETVLVGADNQETIMHGINAFYRRYMAQAISNNMRVITPPDSSVEYNGTVVIPDQTAGLFQDRTAKLILQILLAAMSFLGGAAWGFTKLGDLVHYNPCTIFGAMALVAGSRMCRERHSDADVSRGAGRDEMVSRERDRKQQWERKYRLGWWDDGIVGDDESDQRGRGRGSQDGIRKRKRYGVDVMRPEE